MTFASANPTSASIHGHLGSFSKPTSPIAREITIPLAALRASLESLGATLSSADGNLSPTVNGALEEVDRIAQAVRELCEFASPHASVTETVSCDRVLANVLEAFGSSDTQRIWIAREGSAVEIQSDPRVLERALIHLVQNALEASSGRVLFRVRQSADGTVTFNVTDGGTTDFDDTLALEAFHTDKPAHLGLGLNLASRDIARLGGQFEIQRTALGDTCATVVLPPALQPAKKEGQ